MVKFDEDNDSNGSLILPALLGLVLFILAQVYRRRQLIASLNLPPCYSGWIPFLGCAVEFGKEPLNFIEKMRQQVILIIRGVDNFMTSFSSWKFCAKVSDCPYHVDLECDVKKRFSVKSGAMRMGIISLLTTLYNWSPVEAAIMRSSLKVYGCHDKCQCHSFHHLLLHLFLWLLHVDALYAEFILTFLWIFPIQSIQIQCMSKQAIYGYYNSVAGTSNDYAYK